ncbi:hypothetical protein B0H14DRAFT_2599813 [Mycena olivaceomarginata]|nr:hypothetical protein B0H14DRAFT_2599813 [Mycena olivaceomarginata]
MLEATSWDSESGFSFNIGSSTSGLGTGILASIYVKGIAHTLYVANYRLDVLGILGVTTRKSEVLIAEDMNMNLDEAHDVRDASNEYGDVFQPDNDDELVDTLHRENIKAMQGTTNVFFSQPPPRRKKPTEVPSTTLDVLEKPPANPSRLRKAGMLTLDDFPEPVPKVKKSENNRESEDETGTEKPDGEMCIPIGCIAYFVQFDGCCALDEISVVMQLGDLSDRNLIGTLFLGDIGARADRLCKQIQTW